MELALIKEEISIARIFWSRHRSLISVEHMFCQSQLTLENPTPIKSEWSREVVYEVWEDLEGKQTAERICTTDLQTCFGSPENSFWLILWSVKAKQIQLKRKISVLKKLVATISATATRPLHFYPIIVVRTVVFADIVIILAVFFVSCPWRWCWSLSELKFFYAVWHTPTVLSKTFVHSLTKINRANRTSTSEVTTLYLPICVKNFCIFSCLCSVHTENRTEIINWNQKLHSLFGTEETDFLLFLTCRCRYKLSHFISAYELLHNSTKRMCIERFLKMRKPI